MIGQWRAWIEEKAADALDALADSMESQQDFARQVRSVLSSLDMDDEFGDAGEDDEAEGDEGEGNTDRGETSAEGEEDAGEEEGAPQETEASGEEMDAGETDGLDGDLEELTDDENAEQAEEPGESPAPGHAVLQPASRARLQGLHQPLRRDGHGGRTV